VYSESVTPFDILYAHAAKARLHVPGQMIRVAGRTTSSGEPTRSGTATPWGIVRSLNPAIGDPGPAVAVASRYRKDGGRVAWSS
jgi:hypothetical protein